MLLLTHIFCYGDPARTAPSPDKRVGVKDACEMNVL